MWSIILISFKIIYFGFLIPSYIFFIVLTLSFLLFVFLFFFYFFIICFAWIPCVPYKEGGETVFKRRKRKKGNGVCMGKEMNTIREKKLRQSVIRMKEMEKKMKVWYEKGRKYHRRRKIRIADWWLEWEGWRRKGRRGLRKEEKYHRGRKIRIVGWWLERGEKRKGKVNQKMEENTIGKKNLIARWNK